MSDDPNNPSGYGRPPPATQFKKGQSGNPKGRPKGARNLTVAILAAANERVMIVENGKRKTITKLEAATKHLANKAASGNERAMQMLCNLLQVSEGRLLDTPAGAFASDDDRAVMANLAKRFSKDLATVENVVDTAPDESTSGTQTRPPDGSTP
jgi:hypothetical protein